MSQTVRDVMTTDLVTCPSSAPVMDAAGHMRDRNIGDVLVVDDGSVRGIVTDRDTALFAASWTAVTSVRQRSATCVRGT